MSANIIVFMATGFEEMELTISVDILRRAGMNVKIATLDGTVAPVRGSRGIMMLPDITIDDVVCENIDMIILPGGVEGTKNLAECKKLADILIKMNESGKKISAICAAPAVIVNAKIATGKTLTCHPAAVEYMKNVNFSEDRVVVDGNITTSRAAGTTFEFAFSLVEQLGGKELVNKVNMGVLAKI